MQHDSAHDYLERYTTSLYRTWIEENDDYDDPLSAAAAEESPDFTALFSPHSGLHEAKYRHAAAETLTTLVIYHHFLPDLARRQNGYRPDELTLPPAVVDALMARLRELPATPG